MALDVFAYALAWNASSHLLAGFYVDDLLFNSCVLRVYVFCVSVLRQTGGLQTLSPGPRLVSPSSPQAQSEQSCLMFVRSSLAIFSFMVVSLVSRTFCLALDPKDFLLFFSKSVIVLSP